MKIKKFGHSGILVEDSDVKILIDPGVWSPEIEKAKNIDAILITHEHADHLAPDKIKLLLENNLSAVVYTNESAGNILAENSITFETVADEDSFEVKGVKVNVYGKDHAKIDQDIPVITNIGFLIADRLYHPGDALYNPKREVEFLALPIMAPWARISEMLDYIREIRPKKLFPIHDALLKEVGLYEKQATRVSDSLDVEYIPVLDGEEITL